MVDEKSKWTRSFSAGGIVYKKQDGQIFVLLILPKGPNFGPPRGYWSFPKGLIDEGYTEEQTAVKEVREEGGVNAKIIRPLGTVKFFKNAVKVLKFIDFYLMEYLDGDPKDHDFEVAEAAWVALNEVEAKLQLPHDREIFAKAKTFLIA